MGKKFFQASVLKLDLASKCLLISIFSLCISASSFAFATRPITGKVTSDKGEALSGATVLIKGSSTATTTTADGSYSINVDDNAKALVFSYVGFISQEINITSASTINVSLKSETTGMNDINH